jgi:hypothetical protein
MSETIWLAFGLVSSPDAEHDEAAAGTIARTVAGDGGGGFGCWCVCGLVGEVAQDLEIS